MAFLFSIVFALALPAQETEHPENGEAQATDEAADHSEATEQQEHGAEHLGLRNEIVFFIGVTDEPGHPTEFTWGLEYIYEFAHRWGIGGFIDHAGGSLRNVVVGVPIAYNPGGRWLVMAAPGIEYHNGRGDSVDDHETDGHGETDENEKHFLFRVGAGYSIAIAEHYSMAPTVYLDFVKGEKVWVYGLNFAYKF